MDQLPDFLKAEAARAETLAVDIATGAIVYIGDVETDDEDAEYEVGADTGEAKQEPTIEADTDEAEVGADSDADSAGSSVKTEPDEPEGRTMMICPWCLHGGKEEQFRRHLEWCMNDSFNRDPGAWPFWASEEQAEQVKEEEGEGVASSE